MVRRKHKGKGWVAGVVAQDIASIVATKSKISESSFGVERIVTDCFIAVKCAESVYEMGSMTAHDLSSACCTLFACGRLNIEAH